MKTLPALLALLTALCLAAPADAQQRLSGTFRVEEVNGQEPPESVELTLTFGADGKAAVTYTVADDPPQSWAYAFEVEDGQLTLTPDNAFGDPQSVTYDIRFEGGKLLLLTPEPEEEQEEPEGTEDESGESADETGSTDSADDRPETAPADAGADQETPAETDPADTDDTNPEESGEQTEEQADDEQEQDTREPVWVLTQVN